MKRCICVYQRAKPKSPWRRVLDHPACPVRGHGKRPKWTVIFA